MRRHRSMPGARDAVRSRGAMTETTQNATTRTSRGSRRARPSAVGPRSRVGGLCRRAARRRRQRLLGAGRHVAARHGWRLTGQAGARTQRRRNRRGLGSRGAQADRRRAAVAGCSSPGQLTARSRAVGVGVDRRGRLDRLRPGVDCRGLDGPDRCHPRVVDGGSPGSGVACVPLGSLVSALGASDRGCVAP